MSGRGGSTLAQRPAVHSAAAVRRRRNIDDKLVALAAAEFQDLARPLVAGGDPAGRGLGGHRRPSNDLDGDVRRHADYESHARVEGVKRGWTPELQTGG